jgi:hypothetical protein
VRFQLRYTPDGASIIPAFTKVKASDSRMADLQ